ncbi:hypothetical protein DICVIV_13092 [Dictyocaulus viviparus]|uniref:Uncharacterized protein n=1 Tax=Dictyocaulus viviparus TaxID=29172 RepID=A0A0D8XET0_DICVI|nr:hypothetical protein DICVIV_13092 [Dictyocaulus viviparus]
MATLKGKKINIPKKELCERSFEESSASLTSRLQGLNKYLGGWELCERSFEESSASLTSRLQGLNKYLVVLVIDGHTGGGEELSKCS